MKKLSMFVPHTLSILVGLFFGIQKAPAQFNSAELGVNGLTCSQCSRSVEMSLLKLDFVQEVKMNLENTAGKIVFRKNALIKLNKIAKAVTDAGFSVGSLKVSYTLSDDLSGASPVSFKGVSGLSCFVKPLTGLQKGEILLEVVNKEFMTREEFKVWKNLIKSHCTIKHQELYYLAPAD